MHVDLINKQTTLNKRKLNPIVLGDARFRTI